MEFDERLLIKFFKLCYAGIDFQIWIEIFFCFSAQWIFDWFWSRKGEGFGHLILFIVMW